MGAEAWYGPLRSRVVKSGNEGLGSGNTVVILFVTVELFRPVVVPHATTSLAVRRFQQSACMHPFATYVLRSYYKATGWNEDNLYANFTRSSNGASSPLRRMSALISLKSRPRFHRPSWPAFLHIKVPKHAFSDDVLNECSSLAERIRWLRLHLLRPRYQKLQKCLFQGYSRSFQGLRASEEAESQRRGVSRR